MFLEVVNDQLNAKRETRTTGRGTRDTGHETLNAKRETKS